MTDEAMTLGEALMIARIMTSAVDVAALRRTVDELPRERRELDISIQAANWLSPLAE